jgi:hypothetical protein
MRWRAHAASLRAGALPARIGRWTERALPLAFAVLVGCGDDEGAGRSAGAHEGVACATCHVGPAEGDVVVASADSACTSCHAAAQLSAQVAVAQVRFRHADHPGTAGEPLRCGACHTHERGDAPLVTAAGSCFLCHAELPREPVRPGAAPIESAAMDTAGCRLCHVQPAHTALLASGAPIDHATVLAQGISCLLCHYDVVRGTGAVAEATCRTCHGLAGGPPALTAASARDAGTVHEAHQRGGTGTSCTRCHEPVDHGVIQLASSLVLACSDCHAAAGPALRQPVDSAAHRATQAGYAGLDPHHPAVDPSVHFLERVACTACHSDAAMAAPRRSDAQVSAVDAACRSCHGPRFGGLVAGWVRGMRDNVTTVGTFVRAAAATPAVRQSAAASTLARRAADLWQFVDSAGGVHNLPGADATLRSAADDALTAFRAAGLSPPGTPRLGPAVSREPCMRCHYGVESARQEVFAQLFDHGRHVIDGGIACAECHSAEDLFLEDGRTFDPAHGATPIAAGQCTQCHHVDTPAPCATCHTPSEVAAIAYVADLTVHVQRNDLAHERRVPFAHDAHASVGCAECHAPDDPAQTPAGCTTCHEAHHTQVASPAGCATCHQTAPIPSHRRTDHLECGACHAPATLRMFGTADRAFCLQCHRDLVAHRPAGECAECHLQLTPAEAMMRMLSARHASRTP